MSDPFPTIVDSGEQKQRSPKYQYRYYHDSSVSGPYTALLLIVVGTAMTVSDYSGIAKNSVVGKSIVFCVVDNNPGSLVRNPLGIVKLSGKKAARAFNDMYSHLGERLKGVTFVANPKIVVGGHSAGGSAAIDAMSFPNSDPNHLVLASAGYCGLDPYGTTPLSLPTSPNNISNKNITVPTFAWGFTTQTCGVKVNQAGKAAYNITPPGTNRVFYQVINPKSTKPNQIAHCIFTDNGCFGSFCPSQTVVGSSWVQTAVGNSVQLFVQSLSGTIIVSKSDYIAAIPTNNQSQARVFCNDDSADIKSSIGQI